MSAPIVSVEDLFRHLAEADVRLELRLEVEHPGPELRADLRDLIVAHRPQLLCRLGRDAFRDSLKGQRWGGSTESDVNIEVVAPSRTAQAVAVAAALSDP